MDRQKAFEKALRGVITQGGYSMNDRGPGVATCAYRSPSGCKCAIGHLIPDEKYSADLEYNLVSDLYRHGKLADLIGEKLMDDDFSFLRALQQCHDEAAIDTELAYASRPNDLTLFREAMTFLAKKYDLKMPDDI